MWNTTLIEMKQLLKDSSWMDVTTKSKSIIKVDSMLSYIGYNNEVLDKAKIVAYYDSFLESMDSKSFVKNQVK